MARQTTIKEPFPLSAKIRALLKQFENMMFGGIPPELPLRYYRYVIVSNLLFVFALVGHSLFVPVYWTLGAPLPFWVNLLFVPLDAVCLFLNRRHLYKSAFGLWVGAVILHTLMSSLTFGWASGFHYYLLSLAVFIFMAPWNKGINIVFNGAIMSLYIWLNFHGGGLLTAYPIPPRLAVSTPISNIVVNFIILSYLAYYYAVAAEKAQQTLEASEKTLKTILAASPVGIALVKHRAIFWANDTLERLMGFGGGQMSGLDVVRIYPEMGRMDHLEHLAHEVGRPFIDLPDNQLIRSDGTTFPCHLKIRPITPGDKAAGSIVVVMDTSAHKAAEREKAALLKKMQRAEKLEAVGTMAGGVAHDLNNILSGILSYPDLLLMKIAPTDPMRKPLELIRQCGEKAAAIVQNLLTLTRRGVSVQQPIDLNAAVSDYLKSPEHENLMVNHPQVVLETALCADPPFLAGSPVHLSKTLMNLIANACEAMAGGGTLRLETAARCIEDPFTGYEIIEPGCYAVLSVADSGHGIAKENLERIFEPFFTKKVMGRSGTGLGLAVVWGTVKDCGGFIDVSSGAGGGTRFDLYFPAVPAPGRPAAPPESHEDYKGAGQHVLVVDDLPEQRAVATAMLASLGYKTDAVPSGEAAVAWVRENRTDLLLLDMVMDPGIDGLETYRQILALRPRQKAVIVSGFSETERVAGALTLGAARCMQKPYTLMALGQAVKQALGDERGAGPRA
jgi:PAS domain S-box-containing protein